MINKIFQELEKVSGLKAIAFLNRNMKNLVDNLEEENNHGVFECLERNYTLLLSHDSSFRDPVSEIVDTKNGVVTFPGIDFPEVTGKNVVSSSPSLKVHDALLKSLNLSLATDEATLLVGFNL